MQMRPEIQITSMIKAMKDVVIPALAGSNKLATEQAQLVMGLLSLMSSQLPVQFRFDRDELARLVEHTEALQSIPANDAATAAAIKMMNAHRHEAVDVLDQCRRDPADLNRSIRDLRQSVSNLITTLAKTDDLESQLRVEKIVLELSKGQLLRDRSLLKLQGWEPNPAAVPDITTLVA